MKRDLELKQTFFLGDNVDHKQNVICNQNIISKKTIKKRSNKKYSPSKVKSRNFLTNICYNRLKRIDFDNASFIIDCYTYILFNLNPIFLEQKFDNKSDREHVETLWNYPIPNKFYIYICRNDNFIALNKLSLKYQNTFDILNNFILEDNSNFLLLRGCFKKNALLYQYIYSAPFLKYFCRVDNYGMKSKLTFEVAHAGYWNQQESLRFVQLQSLPVEVKQEQNEIVDEEAVVEVTELVPSKSTTLQKTKKRKRNANNVAKKILLKKKQDEKMARLLSELEANDLQMKRISSNVNK